MNIDNYCERTSTWWWAEPFNAFSNLAFFVAAYFVWRLVREQKCQQKCQENCRDISVYLLIALLLAIGIGSSLFHLFATTQTSLADVIPIFLFQLVYLYAYSRHVMNKALYQCFIMIAIFFALSYIAGTQSQVLYGSIAYFPSLVFILGFSVYHFNNIQRKPWIIALATCLFMLSLCLRTMDIPLCHWIPIGTHFVWHLCNGLVLYLLLHGLIVAKRLG